MSSTPARSLKLRNSCKNQHLATKISRYDEHGNVYIGSLKAPESPLNGNVCTRISKSFQVSCLWRTQFIILVTTLILGAVICYQCYSEIHNASPSARRDLLAFATQKCGIRNGRKCKGNDLKCSSIWDGVCQSKRPKQNLNSPQPQTPQKYQMCCCRIWNDGNGQVCSCDFNFEDQRQCSTGRKVEECDGTLRGSCSRSY